MERLNPIPVKGQIQPLTQKSQPSYIYPLSVSSLPYLINEYGSGFVWLPVWTLRSFSGVFSFLPLFCKPISFSVFIYSRLPFPVVTTFTWITVCFSSSVSLCFSCYLTWISTLWPDSWTLYLCLNLLSLIFNLCHHCCLLFLFVLNHSLNSASVSAFGSFTSACFLVVPHTNIDSDRLYEATCCCCIALFADMGCGEQ